MSIAENILGCGSPKNLRHREDFYPTPRAVTVALMLAEKLSMPDRVWDPACGDGAIARVLDEGGRLVAATDLFDRGYGTPKVDFLKTRLAAERAIVTNPPFKLADKFIRHAVVLDVAYMALLLKADFLHSMRSHLLIEEMWRPARVYALSWRPDFRNQGAPTMCCSWFVWDRTALGDETRLFVLGRR